MKTTILYLISTLCLGVFILSGCDDNSSLVGSSLTPDRDKITIYSDTFHIQASTVYRDSLFSKTTYGLLGEYFDPLYGRLKADYLCQFYCEDEFKFADTPNQNKIDSIYLVLYYSETGNPNTPFQFRIIPVTKPLDKVYYSNANPADYCDLNTVWGSQVYTAASGTVYSDSIQISEKEYLVPRMMKIRLPHELGQKIYEETVNNPASFKTQQAFNEFFPGIYVTTGYGSGCLFNIERTDIRIDYHTIHKSSKGTDSTAYYSAPFITTKEVIQLNRFENSDTEQLLTANDDFSFIKTPAGIYTRLVLPAKEIKPVIEGRMINSMMFNLKFMPNEDWPYSLKPPPHLLLIQEDSVDVFFRERRIEDNFTSFLSSSNEQSGNNGYSATYRTYYFNNIATLLAYHLAVSPDEDLRVLLVPVSRETSSNYTTAIRNFLSPSGVKLRTGKEQMKVSVASSKYENK